MSKTKQFFFAVLSIGIGCLVALVGAEILLRFLPYNQGLRVQPVNAASPILHFEPKRISTWSQGWDFEMVNRGIRTNNYGFRSDFDYDAKDKTPLLAVIGDSYIEAVMVPFGQTAQGRLASAVKDGGRVYNFAASGAGFGQHLAWAQYARDTFKPDGLMILIISNDYNEALFKYERAPAFHYLKERGDGSFELVRENYEPDLVRRVARRSALFLYMALNVRAYAALSRMVYGGPAGRYVANVEADSPNERIHDLKRGVDAYLDMLPERAGLDRSRILFVVDAIRPQVYEADGPEKAKGSTAAVMNAYFIEQARNRGYETIDMTPAFRELHAKDGRKFEFPLNTHYNENGHEQVAEATKKSAVFEKLFRAGRPDQSSR